MAKVGTGARSPLPLALTRETPKRSMLIEVCATTQHAVVCLGDRGGWRWEGLTRTTEKAGTKDG